MSGIRKTKANRLQAQQVERLSTRRVKGRNKVPKVSRTDPKKKGGKPGGRTNPSRPNAS